MLKFIDSAGLGTLFSSPSNGISSWDEGGRTVHPGCFLRKNAESIENKRVEFGRVQKSAQESEVYRHSVLKRCAGNAAKDML